MGLFDDLIAAKGSGTPYDELEPLEPSKVLQMAEAAPGLPADYLAFLETIGGGASLGDQSYMIYGGPTKPSNVYGTGHGPEGVLLFGDDYQGYCNGIDLRTGLVVEVDPSGEEASDLEMTFEAFIRRKIDRLR